MRDLTDKFAVTSQTCALCHGAVELCHADRFLKAAECERAAVIKAVQCFNRILGDKGIVGSVTIVAGCHILMRRAIPAVKFLAHDVTVGARAGIVHKVRVSLGIDKSERAKRNGSAEERGNHERDRERRQQCPDTLPKRRETIHTRDRQYKDGWRNGSDMLIPDASGGLPGTT